MENSSQLKDHRFAPSPEAIKAFRKIKELLSKVQEKLPEIKGLAFFGSQTVGNEHEGSDLDMFVFYEGKDFISPDTIEHEFKSRLGDKGDLKLSVFTENISKEETDEDLKKFINFMDKREENKMFSHGSSAVSAVGSHIPSRFFVGVGQGLYANRKYILDTLEKMPNGEKYFLDIMNSLEFTERAPRKTGKIRDFIPQYERKYPKTISEGRKIFLAHHSDV